MRLKAGIGRARIIGLRPELVLASIVVEACYAEELVDPAARIITAALDGTHTTGSRHYIGAALDFSTHGLEAGALPRFAALVAAALGPDFHVLAEGAGTANEHLHVELHPDVPVEPGPDGGA